jgi:hypothetical protein
LLVACPPRVCPQGLSTYIVRIAPHAIITLMVLDALNGAVHKYAMRHPLQ